MKAMKDSGIEWIGEIPQDWNVKKLKYCVELRLEKTNDLASAVPYIGLEHVSSFTGTLSDTYEPITAFNGDTLDFYSGDVLFGKLRPYLAKAYQADCNGRCSSEFWVMNPQNIEGRYLLYYVLSHGFISNVDHSTLGVKMPRAEWDFAGNERIPVPSRQEQIRIADYLDSKCAEIDALIAAKEKINALLKEQRQSLIYEAVTKGLDPNAPMKDSGVEWIGNVPYGWSTRKAKYIGTFKSGDSITSENIGECDQYPVYGGNGIRGYTNQFTHNGTYILIGRQGALCGNVHLVSGSFWASEHAVVGEIHPVYETRFAYYVFTAFNLNRLSVTAAQPGISVDQISNVLVPVPNCIEAQREICDYLDNACKTLDETIVSNETTIQKLQEYRQSLIYEAVTGKKEC